MSTLTVAKKEFQDGVRSRSLLVMVVLFTALLAVLLYNQLYVIDLARFTEVRRSTRVINKIVSQLSVLVPVLGTMLGYKAIVGERESGSLKLLLSFPHTRWDVMVGKFIGRSAIIVVTVLVGFTVVGIQFAAVSDLFSFTAYALAAGKIAIIGIVFVAIAIAFSTAMRSSMMAMWGAIGLTMLFTFLWDSVLILVETSIRPAPESGTGEMPPAPDWYYLIKRLNPRHALKDGTALGADSTPFYLDPWFGGIILGVWLLVPLGLAYLRFRRSDLA